MVTRPLVLLVLLGAAALGAVALGKPARAGEQSYATVRLGAGDAALGGGAEFIGTNAGLPGWLRWALSPQLTSGGTSGALGLPDPSYRGVTWTMPLATGVLQRNDKLSFGFSLGNGFGDSLAGEDGRDPRTLLPTPTTRLGAAIGYQVTPSIGVYMMFDHVSISGLSREDEYANDLGMRMGLSF